MLVKAIMIPFNQLRCLSVDNTLEEALIIIEENRLLSLPVVDGKQFIGVLSKENLYEEYFKNYCGQSKIEFLNNKVKNMVKTKIMTINQELPIQDAAAIFITSKYRFIPIIDNTNNLLGIVTHQSIFKEYQKIFGDRVNELTIYNCNFKGTIAKMTDTIAKAGGNIKNIVLMDSNVMNLEEIHLSIDCKDFEKVVKALKKNSFNVRTPRIDDK
ncbi:CBS domain-containing protein [Sedimentibacter sp. zth1]|uniref:CBS domain-containing protein n=1 Tax=Sedimentibacter sp. zth1 TaxID=2816908 RepID=UPI001A930CB6|nr:CBS domain-containing protein [Sedimentibacter sp. zth1]QSX06106.1 CBS domain-containing protein [Sedimentibacter sp. zth1]